MKSLSFEQIMAIFEEISKSQLTRLPGVPDDVIVFKDDYIPTQGGCDEVPRFSLVSNDSELPQETSEGD